MKVRRAALNRFGESAIRNGWPMAMMEEALVPLFLHHRYQVESAASALGGQHYVYAMRGAGEPAPQPVPAAEQNAALNALEGNVARSELVVPAAAREIVAASIRLSAHRELFPRYTGLPFDPVTPGLVAADLTIQFVLAPERAARLVTQHARDTALPSLACHRPTGRRTFEDKPAIRYEAARQPGRRARARRSSDDPREDAPMSQVRAIATAASRASARGPMPCWGPMRRMAG